MQSRLSSFIEVCINVAIGFIISLVANVYILGSLHMSITLAENIYICALFTVISVVRGYAVRRWFNRIISNAARRLANVK